MRRKKVPDVRPIPTTRTRTTEELGVQQRPRRMTWHLQSLLYHRLVEDRVHRHLQGPGSHRDRASRKDRNHRGLLCLLTRCWTSCWRTSVLTTSGRRRKFSRDLYQIRLGPQHRSSLQESTTWTGGNPTPTSRTSTRRMRNKNGWTVRQIYFAHRRMQFLHHKKRRHR